MKYLYLPLLFVPFLVAGQKQVQVRIDQMVSNAPFKLHVAYEDDGGVAYEPRRLEYYVSHPVIVHDGGQRTAPKRAYFLVNGGTETVLDLGDMDVEVIEGIEFSIGVDSASNHLDPANYPEDHPLAYQDPSMHWGWVSGYRFVAYEGKCGDGLLHTFEIHSIGDELYKTVQLTTGAEVSADTLVIPLVADYGRLLEDIEIDGGLYAHGNLGAATQIMNNFETRVFSAPLVSSIQNGAEAADIRLMPNPSGVFSTLEWSAVTEAGWIEIHDVAGNLVNSLRTGPGMSRVVLEAPLPGLYFVRVGMDGGGVAVRKWVVCP